MTTPAPTRRTRFASAIVYLSILLLGISLGVVIDQFLGPERPKLIGAQLQIDLLRSAKPIDKLGVSLERDRQGILHMEYPSKDIELVEETPTSIATEGITRFGYSYPLRQGFEIKYEVGNHQKNKPLIFEITVTYDGIRHTHTLYAQENALRVFYQKLQRPDRDESIYIAVYPTARVYKQGEKFNAK